MPKARSPSARGARFLSGVLLLLSVGLLSLWLVLWISGRLGPNPQATSALIGTGGFALLVWIQHRREMKHRDPA